jgi:hypothetical protein
LKADSNTQERVAANRFRRKMTHDGTLVVRIIFSPGSGTTMLLLKTVRLLAETSSIAYNNYIKSRERIAM